MITGCLGSGLLVVVKGWADYFFSLPDLDLDVMSREITSFVTALFSSYRTAWLSWAPLMAGGSITNGLLMGFIELVGN